MVPNGESRSLETYVCCHQTYEPTSPLILTGQSNHDQLWQGLWENERLPGYPSRPFPGSDSANPTLDDAPCKLLRQIGRDQVCNRHIGHKTLSHGRVGFKLRNLQGDKELPGTQ